MPLGPSIRIRWRKAGPGRGQHRGHRFWGRRPSEWIRGRSDLNMCHPTPMAQEVDTATRTISFTLLGDERNVQYTLTAPDADQHYTFTGVLRDVNKVSHVIGGDVLSNDWYTECPAGDPPQQWWWGRKACTGRPARNRAPAFVEGGDASRSVAENSACWHRSGRTDLGKGPRRRQTCIRVPICESASSRLTRRRVR